MPTTKPRITVTDTGHIRELIDQASDFWQQPNRAAALRALLDEGGRSIERARAQRRNDRLAAMASLRGSCQYPDGYLDNLRAEWPQ